MKLSNTKQATQETINNILTSNSSKSQKMKDLFMNGVEITEISKLLQVRYNFVYNVVSNLVIVNDLVVEVKETSSKKETIHKLHESGKTVKEIAIELKTNMNYVHKIVKEFKDSQVSEKKTN